jgi:hypothetical protein
MTWDDDWPYRYQWAGDQLPQKAHWPSRRKTPPFVFLITPTG